MTDSSIPMLLGKEIQIKLANGEVRKGQFAIVDLSNIIASHNENTFLDSSGYPLNEQGDNINSRDYKADKFAQQEVQKIAQNLQPDLLINTGRTPDGTPIISPSGIVVSGNNRTMSIKLAQSNYPEKYKEYKEFLAEEITAFGFDERVGTQVLMGDAIALEGSSFHNPKHIKFTNPVLVRVNYEIPALNTIELDKYNKDDKKTERPIDKAVKLGKMLQGSPQCKEVIGEIIGRYETFSEFYANRNDQKRLMDTLISCNILTDLERPAYFGENGFTDGGKDLLESILVGMVLSKEALLDVSENVKKYRQMLITTLPVLSLNSTLDEFSIIEELNQALILEAKIVNSKLDFKNWINQKNIFDELPSDNILFMNRFLTIGRKRIKENLEKYNNSAKQNQENMLFGEPATKQEIFNKFVVEQLAPEDVNLIFKSETVVSELPPIKANKMEKNAFANGNFYSTNPDKILATQQASTDRWKKPIIVYKGSIDNLAQIDVNYDILTMVSDENPILTNIQTPVSNLTDKDTNAVDNLTSAIEQSPKDASKKRSRQKKMDQPLVTATSENDKLETYTIAEMFKLYNPKVSIDELRVFLWYQIRIGKPVTNSEWYDIAESSRGMLSGNPERLVKQWIEDGLLFYDGELNGITPAYVYLSGNVYDKYRRLVKSELSKNVGKDAEYIIKEYGQEVYDQQVIQLTKVFKEKDAKRLIISSTDENSVTILPNSKFAKSFKINTLVNEIPFRWKTITAGANKRYGQPDFLTTKTSAWDKQDIPELSLRDAFALWLVTDKTISIKQGITYADIINYYIYFKAKPRTTAEKTWDGTYDAQNKKIIAEENAIHERLQSKAKGEGDRLFNEFLDKQLTLNDRVKVEIDWNYQFNNNVAMNYNKIPVAFRMNKFCRGQLLDLLPEKREAVAFTISNGSGLLAYDVGVGKTPSAIFTISAFLDMGFASRPVVVVPNQTYKQWINEFKTFAGHIRLNKMYNLNDSIIEEFQDTNGNTMLMPEGSVTVMTYEGMLKLGFTEATQKTLGNELLTILIQDTSGMADKQAERSILKANTKAQELVGKALAKTKVNIEEFGFDYLCLDEAHACKKVFTNVVGEAPEDTGSSNTESRPISQYKISAGQQSSTAIKGFSICQYIQEKYNGNTQLLTATPFTNSPLEIYSMLAMIGYNRLTNLGLNNLNTFFDTFIQVSYELVINAALNPERKQVILGFNNLIVLQQLVRQFINHKTGESVGVIRPNKWVLPLTKKKVDGVIMQLSESEQVTTTLPMSPIQATYMAQIKEFAEGKITKADLESSSPSSNTADDEDETTTEGVELDEDVLDESEKVGARLLVALNHARNLALSPYLYEFSTLGRPTSINFIESSGKLKYVMECIRTIKQHHESTKTAMGGVVIYSERGVRFFDLIREYLIDNVGLKPHEVGIISSKQKLPIDKGVTDEEAKEYVKNLFLGKKFNKVTLEEEPIPDEQRIKVLIGSATIREGINLQEYSSTLFNCFLSFNPTDLQQLEGRIYRQKNAFANVRIVNPILIDSADIFMFQKLEEKTSRINLVFETDGVTNVLKTEEFNPKELKYSLVKDPKVLAKMEVMEETETISETISDKKNDIKKLEAISEYESYIKNWTDELNDEIKKYRPTSINFTIEERILAIQNVLKTQKDADGKTMVGTYDYEEREKLKTANKLSPLSTAHKQHWFDKFVLSVRNLKRFEKDYLTPKGYKSSQVQTLITEVEKEIEGLIENKKSMSSDDAIAIRSQQIIIKRQELSIKEKTIEQVVSEFKSLNYLLDDVKVRQANKVISQSCPPLDTDGTPRIDAEGLRMLNDCIDASPNTKFSNGRTFKLADGTEAFEYNPERIKLHKKIIKEITQSAVCITHADPIAIIMGGSPGSGKSTFLTLHAPYMTTDKIWKIDADYVRSKLPEYKGWNSPVTHEETRDIVTELLDDYDQPCKHDLLYDGTMSNVNKYNPIIKRLKQLGYKIFLVFMDIPKVEAIKRALSRYKNNKGGEAEYGRFVPIAVVEDFYTTGDDAFQKIKKEVDGYIKIDSLTMQIIEKGGIGIPATRPYNKITQPLPKKDSKESVSLNNLKEMLEGAKITLKYLSGKEKTEMNDYVYGLELTIKYI